jgi:hypothetical protein
MTTKAATSATYTKPNRDCSDPERAWGRCWTETHRQVQAARRQGVAAQYVRVTGRTYPGRQHWALLLDGTVLDVTARQFDPAAGYPLVTALEDWLDDVTEWLCDGVDYAVFDDPDEEPVEVDFWVREDVEPGPMPSPYQRAQSIALRRLVGR